MDLKKQISDAGLKQNHVAKKIGITPEHLNLMLNGRIPMSEGVRNKLTEFLSRVIL